MSDIKPSVLGGLVSIYLSALLSARVSNADVLRHSLYAYIVTGVYKSLLQYYQIGLLQSVLFIVDRHWRLF
jgi:Cft2 family RNA processing exonuclease